MPLLHCRHPTQRRYAEALAQRKPDYWVANCGNLWAAYRLCLHHTVAETTWNGQHLKGGVAIAASLGACEHAQDARSVMHHLLPLYGVARGAMSTAWTTRWRRLTRIAAGCAANTRRAVLGYPKRPGRLPRQKPIFHGNRDRHTDRSDHRQHLLRGRKTVPDDTARVVRRRDSSAGEQRTRRGSKYVFTGSVFGWRRTLLHDQLD